MTQEDYLIHYGVLGMKWGVRKDGKPQGYQGSGRHRSISSGKGGTFGTSVKAMGKSKSRVKKAVSKLGGTKIGDIYETGAVATMLAILLLPSVVAAGKTLQYHVNRRNEKKARKRITSEEQIPKKKREMTQEEDMKSVNPNFNKSRDYQVNCVFCTTAYDMRRRGYDVKARPRKQGGSTESILEYYKNAKAVNMRTGNLEKFFQEAEKQGVGARGNLCVSTLFGGHSMAYEVREDGVHIMDAQTGNERTIKEINEYYPENIEYIRTDNVDVNFETIGEAVTYDELDRKKRRK